MQSNLQKPTQNPKQAWLGKLQLPPALGGASSPPLLGLRLFTSKLSLLKIATANQPITRALHFNRPFLLLCFPQWHLPEQPVSSNSSGHRPLILPLWGAGAGLVPGLTRVLRRFVARKPWAEGGRCHLSQTLPEAPAQHLCGAARVYRPHHGRKEKWFPMTPITLLLEVVAREGRSIWSSEAIHHPSFLGPSQDCGDRAWSLSLQHCVPLPGTMSQD